MKLKRTKFNQPQKIAIIGCGHGGLALSGFFAMQGHEASIYAHPEHPGAIKEVYNQGQVTLTGKINGTGKIKLATTKISTALKGAELIFIALPAIAHEVVFTQMLPYLEDEQVIINLAGHFSGIFQNEILKKSGCTKKIFIADTTSFPYACRILRDCTVEIVAIKEKIGIAFADKSNAMQAYLQPIFPTLLEAKSSLIEVGFYDPCGISHAPNTIFNAGRIGNGEKFFFYKDGITIETATLLEKMDHERLEIGKHLGLNLLPYYEVMNEYYSLKHTSIYDFFKNSQIHNANMFCPSSLYSRYLTESVPYSFCALVQCWNKSRLHSSYN